MEGATPQRLRELLQGWEAALRPAGPTLVELALSFCVRDGRLDPAPSRLVGALADALAAPRPAADPPPSEAPAAEVLARLAAFALDGEATRVVLRCLFLIGVARGALTPEHRRALAGLARGAGIAPAELTEIAQRILADAGRSSDEARALPGGRYALISDIHANLAALEVVLADIDAQGIRRIGCLGDVVGYGPDPVECTDLVRARCAFTLMGNHDIALFEGAEGFNPAARGAIEWTRGLLERSEGGAERLAFLRGLPLERTEGDTLFVHGSPRDPWREYIFPSEASSPKARKKFVEIFARFREFLFVGHTHIPCVITHEGYVATSQELNNTWRRPEGIRAIVNVGSVGQPRDRDPRPCYVVVDGDTIHWRRLRYPAERTVLRIERSGVLDRSLGKRLLRGL